MDMIYSLGSVDEYNTKLPEHLHIDFAKSAYLASNKWDFVEQMAIWLQCREAIFLCSCYLAWCHPEPHTNNPDKDLSDPEELEDLISLPSKHWKVAKNPPFANVTINYIESHHHISNFLPC